MTLPLTLYDEWNHQPSECQSRGIRCDHCLVCGSVVEQYPPNGIATCDAHYQQTLDVEREGEAIG